jgi:hypothetical protein
MMIKVALDYVEYSVKLRNDYIPSGSNIDFESRPKKEDREEWKQKKENGISSIAKSSLSLSF